MIERAKQSWQAFKDSEPGHRFQDRYDNRQQKEQGRWTIGSVAIIALGLVIAVGGLLLVPAPGPGWIITFLGLGLLGSEFAPVARALDWVEIKGRAVAGWMKGVWDSLSSLVKVMLVLLGVCVLAALGYGAYVLVMDG